MTRRIVLAGAIALSCVIPGDRATAQDVQPPRRGIGRWGLVDAVGYGGLGFGAGLIVGLSDETLDGGTVAAIGAFSLVGLVSGAALGQGTVRRIAAGQPISGARRFAATSGAIIGGATLGALASVPLINGEGEGTPLGSDESTFMLLTGTGAALGVLYVLRHTGDFDRGRVAIQPIRTIDAAHGIRLSLRF